MGTYAQLTARVADELSRTDLTSQIALAALSAITYYERRGFYFTETRSMTFSTVNAQEFYTSSDLSDIPNLIRIDAMRIAISSTANWQIFRKSYEYLDEINIGGVIHTGYPVYYAYYAEKIRLYPVPNAVWTVTISGVHPLTALSAASDTNAWTTDVEDLIRYRTKWDIYSNVIGNLEMAGVMAQNEQQALQSIIGVNNSRNATGYVTATKF